MTFSIIIPTCNRNNLLSVCLGLLSPDVQQGNYEYEIIVTDDSAGNIAQSLISEKYPWVKWVSGPKRGPAANRNNGAKNASGEWIIFLDDDCEPCVGLIAAYYNAIQQHKNCKVFEGCIKADRPKGSFVEESPVNEHGGYLWSCNFMISNKLFFDIGAFDDRFPYPAMEDSELHYRLTKNKHEIVFLKEAYVIHPWRTQKAMYAVTIKRFKSLLHFLKMYPENSKGLNAEYYFRVALLDIKELLTKSFDYKFRGIGGQLIHSMLHVRFAIFLLFNSKK